MRIDEQTRELLKEMADQAAAAALKKYKDDEKKLFKKNAFKRAELLLRKYDILMEHCNNAVYTPEDVEIEFEEIKYSEIDEDDLYIKSILRTKTRTQIMLNLIDKSMKSLKIEMESKEKGNRYEAVEFLFFQKMTYEDAAKQLCCDSKTVRRWKNEVIRELSALMFGIDGLDLDL